MTAHEDLSRVHPISTSGNRAFGWVFAGAFLLVGLSPLIGHGAPRAWALVLSALFALIAVAAPALLAAPKRLWARFGLLMNRLVSPVVLAFLFYAVVTPMGMLKRAFAKGNLRAWRDRSAGSYWTRRDPPGPEPDSMRQQF